MNANSDDDEVTQAAPLLQMIQAAHYTRSLGGLTADEQERIAAFLRWAKENDGAPSDPAQTIALLCARHLKVPIESINVDNYERRLFPNQELVLGVVEIPILAGHARWSLANGREVSVRELAALGNASVGEVNRTFSNQARVWDSFRVSPGDAKAWLSKRHVPGF